MGQGVCGEGLDSLVDYRTCVLIVRDCLPVVNELFRRADHEPENLWKPPEALAHGPLRLGALGLPGRLGLLCRAWRRRSIAALGAALRDASGAGLSGQVSA